MSVVLNLLLLPPLPRGLGLLRGPKRPRLPRGVLAIVAVTTVLTVLLIIFYIYSYIIFIATSNYSPIGYR